MSRVFCMNSKCIHYIEDNCERDLNDKTTETGKNGKCANFIVGENEFYKQFNTNQSEAQPNDR